MKSVIRQLDCDEEQKIMEEALLYVTIAGKPLPRRIRNALAQMILSTLSGMGYKIVEGTCN